MRSYYCSNKFKFLKIDLERQMTYNCHAATPHRIDFHWLTSNPGNIFNTPTNIAERELMLDNQRNASCENNCWPAEDRGQVSIRQLEFGEEVTHTTVHTNPEILDLTLDSECNLACVYCCKEYSSSWRRDIQENGDYTFDSNSEDLKNRYRIDQKDVILSALSQQGKRSSQRYQQLLTEIDLLMPGLKQLVITGGEPLLSTQLTALLNKAASVPNIKLFTGLGVSTARLNKVLDLLPSTNNIVFTVSAESTGKNYEFVRAGNSYDNFIKNLSVLKQRNIKFQFHSTISNLNLHGFVDFYNLNKDSNIKIGFAYTPDFLAPHVLDPESKHSISEQLGLLNSNIADQIATSLSSDATDTQRKNLGNMLTQFSQRRKLTLDIFPQHFLDWIYS